MVGKLSTDTVAAGRAQGTLARGGLLTFGLLLLPLSLLGYWFLDMTRASLPLNLPTLPLMLAPAVASMGTRLTRREGFADISFRLGGRRSLEVLVLGLVLPMLVGALAYGSAYLSGLAHLVPPELPLLPSSAGPVAHLAALLVLTGSLGTLALLPGAAGEEIGWRGYLLPRLVAAGVPQPILLTGLVWGLWHLVPLFASGYAAGPSALLSAGALLVNAVSLGFVLAWLRLDSGSIWPAVGAHAAWNAIINGGFDLVTEGEGARLWTGESGLLVTLALGLVTLGLGWARRRRGRAPQTAGRPR